MSKEVPPIPVSDADLKRWSEIEERIKLVDSWLPDSTWPIGWTLMEQAHEDRKFLLTMLELSHHARGIQHKMLSYIGFVLGDESDPQRAADRAKEHIHKLEQGVPICHGDHIDSPESVRCGHMCEVWGTRFGGWCCQCWNDDSGSGTTVTLCALCRERADHAKAPRGRKGSRPQRSGLEGTRPEDNR